MEDATQEDIIDDSKKDKIKHIVISGGSIWGFYAYGCVKQACLEGFIEMDSIKTIYGTSVGALIAVVLSLKLEFSWIDDYLILRPWHKLFNMNIIDIYNNKGTCSHTFFEEFFGPLFKAKDISVDITLQELYIATGIEIHVYSTEMNEYKLYDLSYKTHPDFKVLDAIHASCALPILISPIFHGNKCWMDGGFFLNYPILKCLENVENKSEIFGITLGNRNKKGDSEILTSESSFTDILLNVFSRIIQNSLFVNKDCGIIPYEINMVSKEITMDFFTSILKNSDERAKLIQSGVDDTKELIEKWSTINRNSVNL